MSGTIRDKLWIWGQEAGCFHRNAGNCWKLPGASRMTPTEGAHYMGIPNVMVVRFQNQPAPPFRQYALPMRSLDRVVWSIIGDAGSVDNDRQPDLDAVLDLAGAFPNVTGAIMDDFFRDRPGGPGRYSPGQVDAFRRRLHGGPRALDLYVVVYAHDLHLPIKQHLQAVDAVTFWTWKAEDLQNLEANLERLEALIPGKRTLLGIYMWDFGASAPMPRAAMEHQCRLGLDWLRAGRVEGLVFLASCIADLELEAVEYARGLIGKVGDEPLHG